MVLDDFPEDIAQDDYKRTQYEKQYAMSERMQAEYEPSYFIALRKAQEVIEDHARKFEEQNPIKDKKSERWKVWGVKYPDIWFFGMTSNLCEAAWIQGILKGGLFGITMASITGFKLALYNSHSRLLFVRWAVLWTVPSILLWSSYAHSACTASYMDTSLLRKLKNDPRFK
mmetsp:Transcript_28284/g.39940  ORF Transcript_28284/g.39940 Transcript_28284/m.39940 type:complete len:171 (+) Transcript_28284:19-531(+)